MRAGAALSPRSALAPSRWLHGALDLAAAYLPLLLMGLLALGSWWLVKLTPIDEGPGPVAPVRHEPDYAMNDFVVQRYAPDGSLRLQIEGDALRHYPDTDTLEIDNARIEGIGLDGRRVTATARRAMAHADGSEAQLSGGANVLHEAGNGHEAIEFRGEFLHALVNLERVKSHLPVTVLRGTTELHAGAMDYDNTTRVLELKGRIRAVIASPPPGRGP